VRVEIIESVARTTFGRALAGARRKLRKATDHSEAAFYEGYVSGMERAKFLLEKERA
jgi:hypothetical protein